MEALMASYGDASSDSDADASPPTTKRRISPPGGAQLESTERVALPPPPLSLLTPPNSYLGSLEYSQEEQANRVRSFPHVDGNYALHVYIPGFTTGLVMTAVFFTCAVYVPQSSKKELAIFLKKICSLVPGLHVVEADVALGTLCKDDVKLERVAIAREFHISLGRTVAIRVHQMDSMVSMLRQRLQLSKRYWIDFNKWEVFVNDDQTRTFLSVEVLTGGLAEIVKQIQLVNEVYKLHNLPEFYKDLRPHISLAWASGDVGDSLKRAVEQETKRSSTGAALRKCIFSCKFGGIECKIGNKTYKICKAENDK